ncbi:MAG: U32 family peptidase [Spirochaetes bacterium]|nr:U32 family peptidase [Spirochaetota bacterium]
MELLSPAGSIEKLFYAYEYGADAAYIGLKNFSLRAKADNFRDDEYNEIKKIKKNKKLYAALNIYFHDSDIKLLEEEIEYISLYPIDAFIISDLGILPLLQKYFPGKELHLSTQANCVNSNSAKLYRDMGFSRIIPGRELSLKEIEAIKNNAENLEVEVFVHGAMCLAYSGRCFLSKYLADRSANKGDCSHSCRWQYRVLEESERQGEFFPLLEGENFTSILSSKDLCMIDHLQDLKNAGVDSLKIEGRMKSVYYTAVVTRAYRKALDSLMGKTVENLETYKNELLKVSHREFSTGFFFGKDEIEMPTFKAYEREYAFLGTITEALTPEACFYESNSSKETFLYRLDVKNQIRDSDTIEYIGPDIIYLEDSGFYLLDENMKKIEKTDHGKVTYLQTDRILDPGYILRRRS